MNSGWLLPLIDVAPRMTMRDEPPCVVALVTLMPAILPDSAETKLVVRALLTSDDESIVCCATPSAFFSFSMPSAVTTTPVSCVAAVASVKFCDTVPADSVIVADRGLNPRRRAVTTTCWFVAGMLNEYWPCSFVVAPTRRLGMRTLTAWSGLPDSPVTVPETVVLCDCASAGTAPTSTHSTLTIPLKEVDMCYPRAAGLTPAHPHRSASSAFWASVATQPFRDEGFLAKEALRERLTCSTPRGPFDVTWLFC